MFGDAQLKVAGYRTAHSERQLLMNDPKPEPAPIGGSGIRRMVWPREIIVASGDGSAYVRRYR